MVARLVSALLLLLPLPALAQMPSPPPGFPPPARSVTVLGSAHADVPPDQAEVHVGIYAEEQALAVAKERGDQQIAKLNHIARALAIPDKNVRTEHANVQPMYDYGQGGGKPVLRGYAVTVNVRLILEDIYRLGELMQQLTDNGFDRINGVNFTLKDQQAVQEKLLLEAMANAKTKATSLAARMGEKLGRPLSVVEDGAAQQMPIPVPVMAAMGRAEMAQSAMPSYAPPGSQRIEQRVTASFSLE